VAWRGAGLSLGLAAASLVSSGAETKMDPATQLARDSNAFAFELYARLRATPGNQVVSPASLTTALAMTWGGARGETAEQMKRALHFTGTPGEVMQASGRLSASLTDPARPLVFRIANRLFVEKSFQLQASFESATRAAYGAATEALDFKAAPEPARLRINGWVEGQTQNRIRNLVPARGVDGETRLVLVNAIYFLGDWEEAFTKEATRPAPFHLTASTTKSVATMHRLDTLRFAQTAGLKALDLPYAGGAMSMLLVLPDGIDGLPALEASLSPTKVESVIASLTSTRVLVALPKFEIDPASSLSLRELLESMGMGLAFDKVKADFTGIANPLDPRDRLSIGNVFHKAFVKVDEKGTEAAAATAVAMQRVGAAAPITKPAEFIADHPFLFLIRDNATGLIVFMGRVAEP